ncbi:MAG: FAD-dependent oxidoreductase, partial [Acidobacteriota bacterium]
MGQLRVVIIGGGFGGLNAALGLGGLAVDVTLIDKRNFHLFQPLLYQVATAGLSPGDVAAPLRSVLRSKKSVTVLLEEVTEIQTGARVLKTTSGEIPYDILILAAGADNFYFGHDEWAAFAPALKSIEDATAVRSEILSAFENAEKETDPAIRREWLRFVVVGGGPTGVELAGAIAEIGRDTLRNDFRRIHPEESEIILLDAGARVLAAMPADLSEKAEQALIALGVRTLTQCRVTAVDACSVSFHSP